MIGQIFSHYRILEKLGEGGMGVVYKAQDTKLLRPVALKFLSPDLTRDEDAKRRFMQEARAASALDHPNIGVVHEINETADGRSFICMTYYEGQTLKSKMAKGRMSIDEATRIVLQISNGLQRAHESKIVHRDIKPANIIITSHGDVKIVDFGLAKLAAPSRETMTHTTGGTAAYMSPEQVLGNEADARSDLFSLGVVFYEALTGRRPFLGEHEPALFYSIVNTEPPPPTAVRGDLPKELERIILRLLQKDPKNRYQNAADLRADLRQYLGESLTPRPVRRLRKLWHSKYSLPIIISGSVVVAMVILLASGIIQQWFGGPQLPEKKIVALLESSFSGGDSTKKALCDGLLETVASKLVHLHGDRQDLKILSLSESRPYAKTSDVRRALGVTIGIEFSFRWELSRLQTIINIVDAKNLTILRSDRIPGAPEITSQLETDIIKSIVKMMGGELRTADLMALSVPDSRDDNAYRFYLEGRGFLSDFSKLTNIDAAVNAFQKALVIDSTYALAYAGLGEAYWRKYDATKDTQWTLPALNSCRNALRLGDSFAAVHVTMGIVQQGRGAYEDAVQQFERAIALEPLNSEAFRELARTYQFLNDTLKAEATYRQAIQLNPGYWAGYNSLGVYYYRRQRLEMAVAEFQRATDFAPENVRLLDNVGGIYFLLGRWEEARTYFERSIALDPEDAFAYSNLGTLYFYQERYADAARVYENAVKKLPKNSHFWGYLASAYQWSGAAHSTVDSLFRIAIAGTEQQLRINPRDAELLCTLSEYYALTGAKPKALDYLEQALKLQPTNVRLMGHAGTVYEELGDRSMALKLIADARKKGLALEDVEHDPAMKELRKDPRYTAIRKGETPTREKK